MPVAAADHFVGQVTSIFSDRARTYGRTVKRCFQHKHTTKGLEDMGRNTHSTVTLCSRIGLEEGAYGLCGRADFAQR